MDFQKVFIIVGYFLSSAPLTNCTHTFCMTADLTNPVKGSIITF